MPKLCQVVVSCVSAFSVDFWLQTNLFQSGVLWHLLLYLFDYDFTLEEGGVEKSDESNQQVAMMILVIIIIIVVTVVISAVIVIVVKPAGCYDRHRHRCRCCISAVIVIVVIIHVVAVQRCCRQVLLFYVFMLNQEKMPQSYSRLNDALQEQFQMILAIIITTRTTNNTCEQFLQPVPQIRPVNCALYKFIYLLTYLITRA